jgi:hypothetical protein
MEGEGCVPPCFSEEFVNKGLISLRGNKSVEVADKKGEILLVLVDTR